jgi:hypothetical protein
MARFKITSNGEIQLTAEEESSRDAEEAAWLSKRIFLDRENMIVTRFQALVAMHNAGLLETVKTIMADPATDVLVKLAWDNAQTFERMSPTVLALAQTLSLTDEQLDTLFTQASQIKA